MTMHPTNALLVVAKRPAPGQTKTRLSPPLTPDEAAMLYDCFLRDTVEIMRRVPQVQPVIAYLPYEERAFFADLAPDFELIPQTGQDLGERLDHALKTYLEQGYRHVAIMNSDGPTLPPTYIQEAFTALAEGCDVVLGPSDDGGYYLIGIRHPAHRLLREVQMSTPTVLAETLALAREEGLRVHLLPSWYDVDDVATLARLVTELQFAAPDVAPHTRRLRAQKGGW
jgi:rSAM/selenodomain-associated transferase 1